MLLLLYGDPVKFWFVWTFFRNGVVVAENGGGVEPFCRRDGSERDQSHHDLLKLGTATALARGRGFAAGQSAFFGQWQGFGCLRS